MVTLSRHCCRVFSSGIFTFEFHAVELLLCCHAGKHFCLDAGGSHLNSLQDGGLEYVEAGVDLVGDKLLRLLHKLVNFSRLL